MSSTSFDLPILMYHHQEADGNSLSPYAIHAGHFIDQLDALMRAGFVTLSFQELFTMLAGKIPIPPRAVIITFDDGYESFRQLALPALLSRKMKATVFIVAGRIGADNDWDRACGIPVRKLMDDDGIRTMLSAGMEIGAHGWAHRNQCQCSTPELEEEIFKSRNELELRFGTAPVIFSYPYGAHAKSNFPLLQKAGYSGAVSIFSDQPAVTSNLFSMRRIYIHAGDTGWRFRLKLSPPYHRYVAWRDSRSSVNRT